MWRVRLARWSVALVVLAGVVSLAGGLLALVWSPDVPAASSDGCTDPPCLGLDLGGTSPLAFLAFGTHLVLLGVALLIGGVALLLNMVSAARGHGRRAFAVGAVAVLGPILVLVGGEVLPHVLNPCILPELARVEPPGFCARTAEGADVPENWHALDHAVVGFLPLSLLVGWWWKRRVSGATAGAENVSQ